jgi:hypothetical protein
MEELNIDAGIAKPETTLEGRQEDISIKAFNKERDAYVSPSMRHGKFQHGYSLHNAAYKYVETLEHQKHAAHQNDENHTDGGSHGDPGEHQAQPQPGSTAPNSSENTSNGGPTTSERDKPKKRIRDVIGRIGKAISREYRVMESTKPRDYALLVYENFSDVLDQKRIQLKESTVNRFKAAVEGIGNVQVSKRFKAWRAGAEARKEQRQNDAQQRIDVVNEAAFVRDSRQDGKELLRDIRRAADQQEKQRQADANAQAKQQVAQKAIDAIEEEVE